MEILGTTTIRPVLFYSGKIAGYGLWAALLTSYLPVLRSIGSSIPALRISAGVLFVLGFALCLASIVFLGQSTSLGLPKTNAELKTGGLYRVSRNPIYVGFHLMTLASLTGLGRW